MFDHDTGKYIDIRFTPNGKLSGASIETVRYTDFLDDGLFIM